MLPTRIFFNDFFDDFESQKGLDRVMKCDIYEKEGNYIIEVDVPGVSKNDINIELTDGYLTISVEKKENIKENENKRYVRRERYSYAKYERQFYVGNISEDEIKAKFNNGILEILIPIKDEKCESKKIIEIEG